MDWKRTKYHTWFISHEKFRFSINYLLDIYDETCRINDSIFKPLVASIRRHLIYEASHLFKRYTFPETFTEDLVMLAELHTKSDEEKRAFCLKFLEQMRKEEDLLSQQIAAPKINPGLNSNGE